MDFFKTITRRKLIALILIVVAVVTLSAIGVLAAPPLFY